MTLVWISLAYRSRRIPSRLATGASATRLRCDPRIDWNALEDYPEDGEAQIAQTIVGQQRLVIRRTRLIDQQAELWPDWRCFRVRSLWG